MDKNTFTGLFLIMVIFGASVFFMKPDQAELKKERERITTDSLKKAHINKPVVKLENKSEIDSAALKGPFGANLTGTVQEIVLQNDNVKLTLSTLGGKIVAAQVKTDYAYNNKPLILFKGNDNQFGLNLNINGKTINTNDLYFISTVNGNSVSMRANYNANQYIEFLYSLKPNASTADFVINLVGLNQAIQNNNIDLNWKTALLQQEKDIKKEQENSSIFYKYIDKNPEHLNLHKDEKQELKESKIEWFSFKQHFFSAVLIPQTPFESGAFEIKLNTEPGKVKTYNAIVKMPFNQLAAQSYPMTFYFGNNKFSALKAQGYALEKQVYLGYWPLKYINRFIVLPIFNLLDNFGWSFGLIILTLTVLLKAAMSPLTYKSYLSTAKMRILKPEMDEIKAKVGDNNPTLLQQEYLKLYKQVGVNPLGGCLPMLLQLPFTMAFFFFFPNLYELRGQSFLWMKDLSTYDEFIRFGFNIPFLGDHLSLMCILMTISTLIYTYFNNQISGVSGQMKYISYIIPVVILGMLNSYPSGLNYYYFLANIFTFLQQYIIRKMVNDEKIHAILQENRKKPKPEKKKSKFQTKMDEYLKSAQQQQARPNKK